MTFVLVSHQVNNATARVVTKKPQTPLVNGDISSKITSLDCGRQPVGDKLTEVLFSDTASGWKINPVMGTMYAPELYTGEL